MGDRRPSRLNVEPELFADPRYQVLVEKVGRFVAGGMILDFWRLAQGYYKTGRRVPKDLFELGGYGPLLAVGLAKEEPDGIRAAGEGEQFGWLRGKAAAGAEGGRKSGEARRSKAKQNEASRSETNPPSPPPSPSRSTNEEESAAPQAPLSLPPPSASGAQENLAAIALTNRADTAVLDPTRARDATPAPKPKKAVADVQDAVAAYCDAFAARYDTRPPVGGKEAGIIRRLLARVGGLERFRELVQAYLQMQGDRDWFAKRTHDLVTLETNVNQVVVALSRGDPNAVGFDWARFWGSIEEKGDGPRTLREAVEATS